MGNFDFTLLMVSFLFTIQAWPPPTPIPDLSWYSINFAAT